MNDMSMNSIGQGVTRWAWLLGAMSAVLNVSCGSPNPAEIRDTTGATFSWKCSVDDGCTVAPIDAPSPVQCGTSKVFYSWFQGNFVHICSAASLPRDGAWSTDASLCRFVACSSDDECPQWPDATYACSAGLCRNVAPKGALIEEGDVVELCMAGVPRPSDCRAQLNDPDVASQFDRAHQSCESLNGPCTIPADCRQP